MIWTSRKFWAIVLPLVVILVCQFFPSFHLNMEAATGLVVILASYIVGVAVDPGGNAGTWMGIIASRKFWAATIGLVVMILDGFNVKLPAPFSPNTLIELAALIGAYIGGVAIEGARKPVPQKGKEL